MFSQIDDDLNTQKDCTDEHKELLLVYGRQLRTQKEVNQDLSSCIATLEEEACVHEAQVDGLVNSVDGLRATINSMMDRLCHCTDGKDKEREVVVKIEEESDVLPPFLRLSDAGNIPYRVPLDSSVPLQAYPPSNDLLRRLLRILQTTHSELRAHSPSSLPSSETDSPL